MTFAFVTQYWLVDTRTSEEVCRKGINARNEERVSETWSGAARAVKALEGAVRDNISRLIEELAKANLQPSRNLALQQCSSTQPGYDELTRYERVSCILGK